MIHARPDPALRGVRIAVDVGTVRVGVAISDPDGILATPVTTLTRDPVDNHDLAQLELLVTQRQVVEVVVGLPRTLRGTLGSAAEAAERYAAALAARLTPIPVVFVDERMTTVVAHRSLAQAGRRSHQRRGVIDQAAATAILQTALDGLARERRA